MTTTAGVTGSGSGVGGSVVGGSGVSGSCVTGSGVGGSGVTGSCVTGPDGGIWPPATKSMPPLPFIGVIPGRFGWGYRGGKYAGGGSGGPSILLTGA